MGEKPNEVDELAVGDQAVERSGGTMSSVQNMKARTADGGAEPEPAEASNLNASKSNREGAGEQGQEMRRVVEEAKESPGPAQPGSGPASPGGPGPATGGGP
jgi:hypothetical protein